MGSSGLSIEGVRRGLKGLALPSGERSVGDRGGKVVKVVLCGDFLGGSHVWLSG